jgi:hypothetical protein
MKLRVNGGTLDVDIIDGLSDIRDRLRKLADEDDKKTKEAISRAGESPSSSLSNKQDKLNAKPRMPI